MTTATGQDPALRHDHGWAEDVDEARAGCPACLAACPTCGARLAGDGTHIALMSGAHIEAAVPA